ncbi:L,D-transpeptidase family protein [Luteococcus sp. Sow4_B9]|uniref:L,D-transpeptidase family protein n=1 Tax=Luteococcus sp. Sow4_B9 TaxID=3438792 RepID=UPI003F9A9B9A
MSNAHTRVLVATAAAASLIAGSGLAAFAAPTPEPSPTPSVTGASVTGASSPETSATPEAAAQETTSPAAPTATPTTAPTTASAPATTQAPATVAPSPVRVSAATTAPTTTPTASTSGAVAWLGSTGPTVRTIQYNLSKLGLLTSADITNTFDARTEAAVKKFQAARGRVANGIVGKYDYYLITKWGGAVKTTTTTTTTTGAVAQVGSTGATVRSIQYNLSKLGLMSSADITGYYGTRTEAAVKKFQAARGRVANGIVGKYDYYLITKWGGAVKTSPAASKLDSRCRTGRAVCIDKGDRKMYWVINGQIKAQYDVRTGRPGLETRSGAFSVYRKHPNWYSTLYRVYMPYTMFFSGGQAIHYSAEFARIGYSGAGSHGCVNMRSMSDAKWLYEQVRVGDKVIVTA